MLKILLSTLDWFVYLIDIKCIDHLSSNIDDCGHDVPKSQPYLLCNYLEKVNDNKKGVLYQKSKKNMFSFTKRVYPLIEFESNYKKICNSRFIEVLNCVKFMAAGSLF